MGKVVHSVGILEDDDDMRGYLSTIITQANGLEVGFSAACVKDAIACAKKTSVDICLVDLQLPDGSGLEFARHIKAKSEAKILILTVLGDRTSVLMSLQAGANGYLLKDTAPEQITRSVRDTLAGESPISPQAATHLLQMLQNDVGGKSNENDDILTKREQEILNLFARGLSYKETANTLDISPHTVADHVKSIYTKLSVHSRNEAIFEATQLGLIS